MQPKDITFIVSKVKFLKGLLVLEELVKFPLVKFNNSVMLHTCEILFITIKIFGKRDGVKCTSSFNVDVTILHVLKKDKNFILLIGNNASFTGKIIVLC